MTNNDFPAGACDTHMHIYDSRYVAASSAIAATTRRDESPTTGSYSRVSVCSESSSFNRARTGSTTPALSTPSLSSVTMRELSLSSTIESAVPSSIY